VIWFFWRGFMGFWNIKYRNCQFRLLSVDIFSYFYCFSIFFHIFPYFSYFFVFLRIFSYFFIFFIFFHIFYIFSLKIRGFTDIFSSWLPLELLFDWGAVSVRVSLTGCSGRLNWTVAVTDVRGFVGLALISQLHDHPVGQPGRTSPFSPSLLVCWHRN
jgi:hypothetical protein